MTVHVVQDLSETLSLINFAMKWHDVLKESSSPDSYKEKHLSVLCGSSPAGGDIEHALSFR